MPAALEMLKEAVGSAAIIAPAPIVQAKTVHAGGKAKLIAVAAIVLAVGVAGSLGIHFWSSSHSGTQTPAAPAVIEAKAPSSASMLDKSIAVLPFTDLSEKHDQEYFADGMAEEIVDLLATIPGVKVIGRTSSFQFKGKNEDLRTIGAQLGAVYILEGSVRKTGDRVRITAQLIGTQDGMHRWSNSFDSDVIDVVKVQDTIAAEIARALQIAIEVDIAPHASTKSPRVLEAYLRARQSLDRQTRWSTEAAVANFQQALALDPMFAPAAVGLANANLLIGVEGWVPTHIAFERAREAALLAQRLAPKSPAPHVMLAGIHIFYDWDWAGADQELQQAFALGPRESKGVATASRLAAARGRWEEAQQLAIEAIELDPLDPEAHLAVGQEIYLRSGRLVEAEQSLRHALQISPELGTGHYWLGEALMLQGRYDEALAEFRKETLDDGQLEGSAMVHFATGRKSESDAQLSAAIRHNGALWASEIARVYAYRGEKDLAFEWLDRAYEARDEDLYFIKSDPLVKNLEGDPRYKDTKCS